MNEAQVGRLADSEQAARTPPRLLIRIFWMLHRTVCRLTRGRFGLSQPRAGERFGFMRLNTVGRRSGRARVAIVGYYPDGPNLVTLAMNGWGDAEPAWWLNLQAAPDITVDLADGPRAVRARAASGEERERLWSKFGDYPGWGDDLDALAARRPDETAVVVLEPRLVAARTGRAGGRGRASAASATRDGGSTATPARVTGPHPRFRLRHLWIVPGVGVALFANAQASQLGVGLVPLLVFGIVPDLPRFMGLRRPAMLTLHNATHQPTLALALVVGSAVTGMSPFAYVGALAWLGHIVVGWGIGDRIGPAGERRTAGSRGVRPGLLVLAPEGARGSVR